MVLCSSQTNPLVHLVVWTLFVAQQKGPHSLPSAELECCHHTTGISNMVGGVYCLIGGETREARRWVREGRREALTEWEINIANLQLWSMNHVLSYDTRIEFLYWKNINSVYDVTVHKRAHLKLKYLLCLLFYFNSVYDVTVHKRAHLLLCLLHLWCHTNGTWLETRSVRPGRKVRTCSLTEWEINIANLQLWSMNHVLTSYDTRIFCWALGWAVH